MTAPLHSLSPLDGRYVGVAAPLANYFSEFAYLRDRVRVELDYLAALSSTGLVRALCVSETAALDAVKSGFSTADAEAIQAHDYERAMSLRSTSFKDAFRTLKTMVRALPHPPADGQKCYRIAVFNAGAPAPGMNTAARAAVRLGLDLGHIMLGVNNGYEGLAEGDGK